MRVVPRHPTLVPAVPTHLNHSFFRPVFGVLYILFSLACSIVYLSILEIAFSNDLYWTGYNVSTHQALLIDLFNGFLATHRNGSFDLLQASVDKRYDAPASTTQVYHTYVRRLIFVELTCVEYAVANLRTMHATWSMQMNTQYCWVDLNHEFEIAHTAARQDRCYNRYRNNGAVYMETVLRNLDWDAFLGAWGASFSVSILTWLQHLPSGQAWLRATSSAQTTVADEIAYWKSNNITSFILQYQNQLQPAMIETLSVENAFMLAQVIELKNTAIAIFASGCTSCIMHQTPGSDMMSLQQANRSLIRSAPTSFVQVPAFSFEDSLHLNDGEGDYVNQLGVFRATVGPFNAVDLFYVAVPPELLAAYDAFQATLTSAIDRKNKLAMDAIPDFTLDGSPPSWTESSDVVFYGGNPMCVNGGPLPYVQETFNFYDTCSNPTPLVTSLTKYSSVFACVAMGNTFAIDSICALGSTSTSTSCHTILSQVAAAASSSTKLAPSNSPSSFHDVATSIRRLNISIMQFASALDGSNWTLLVQPLLQDPAWAYFGWTLLHDWVHGKREVVSFEGDVASLVLISTSDVPQLVASSPHSMHAATTYIYYLLVYVTGVLGLVGAAIFVGVIGTRGSIEGRHLVWFNRIVGSIWIGRPLLFVRGVTAMFLLSTAQVQPITSGFHSNFVLEPRSWLSTLVICGETTWVLYVVQDMLTVVDGGLTPFYGPPSCAFAWVAVILLDSFWPLQPTVALQQRCTSPNMGTFVQCTAGTLAMGRFERFEAILVIQLVSSGLMVGIVKCFSPKDATHRWNRDAHHVLGVARVFFTTPGDDLGPIDNVSCLMAGCIRLRLPTGIVYTFDIKLWVGQFHRSDVVVPTIQNVDKLRIRPAKKNLRLLVVGFGLAHTVMAIVSSVVYLNVSKVDLANDLFWSSFNMTGTHAFLSNWFSEQLRLGVNNQTFALTLDWINQGGSWNLSSASVTSAGNYGAHLHFTELNTIDVAIAGLRASDACSIPWLFTQYCFLDFGQRWELANSAARQQRCHAMTTNGAAFLESVLRNVKFDDFYFCWGLAFDIAIANELQTSRDGQLWLATVSALVKASVSDERAMWTRHGIQSFTTQWQNFKHVGLLNTYSVTNMFGVSYPFTLQSQDALYRIDQQTTFKMYWGLANDFTAVACNSSGIIGGQSLVRSSAQFAFANKSLESVLVQNGTLSMPLTNAFMLTRTAVGPFGSVDMLFINCPFEASDAVRQILQLLRHTIANNVEAQIAYGLISADWGNPYPAPKAWTNIGFLAAGGSLLCAEYDPGFLSPISNGLTYLTSWDYACSTNGGVTYLFLENKIMLLATVLANINSSVLATNACARDVTKYAACLAMMNQTMSFIATFVSPFDLRILTQAASRATIAIQSLNVEFIQYGKVDTKSTLELYRIQVLDPHEIDFAFFTWVFLVDWTMGLREAISFQGDSGTMAILSEYLQPIHQSINMNEIHVTLSAYLRGAVLYVTFSMIGLASLMLVYFLLCQGHVEVWNLFLLERVGAIVWIGRPLLFARSLTAVGFLATANLQLQTSGAISYFEVAQPSILKIFLAANEITWLVAILNDMALACTKQYTRKYAGYDSVLVWLVTALFSLWSPVTHSVTIDKQCQVTQHDYQVVCTSASITIGRVSRLLSLVVVAVVANFLGYLLTRLNLRRLPPLPQFVHSKYLYGGAMYLFSTSSWVRGDVYYMDRMTAILNGILTLRWHRTIYGLDVKLWHTFQVAIEDGSQCEATAATTLAIPLQQHG
ncbi:Aste57867_22080 [Aphanomyces stellatus]|uniref:Aste57867_22080 protein n=1 Tax=Aphanomyces stellatus TaxID=120398 RepID=A0A485LJA1_9STRA|nr:hypothetical protein As57867_022011 [Aphanomyces stellatus]VFT98748.1 Aste57867_22080 [Aphanomyces stellatus]